MTGARAPCSFRQLLPETWVFRDEHPDYGIDGEVEVFDDAANPTGRQSKKSVPYLSRLSPTLARERFELPRDRTAWPSDPAAARAQLAAAA